MAVSEAIVAPHGGGLSNLVFCRPGTKVIEIFSPELVAGYFWKLSNQLGLDYYYVLGKGSSETKDPGYAQSWNARTDIEVDLESLRDTLSLANIHPNESTGSRLHMLIRKYLSATAIGCASEPTSVK